MSDISLHHVEVPDSERGGFSKLIWKRGPQRKEDHFPIVSETEFSGISEIKLKYNSSSFTQSPPVTPSQHPSNKTFSSRESSPFDESSCVLDDVCVEGENEKKSPSKYGGKTYSIRSNQKEFKLKKGENMFQVTGKGTKLMKSLNFPTVIVKFLTGNLDKSRVYIVVLEVGAELKSEILALMFSSPYAHKKTRFAELLPFGLVEHSKSVCLTPILQRKRYKRIFHRGFSFKIKSLIPGRQIDGSGEYPWNRYDLTKEDMQNLPKEIIGLDIMQMSLLTTHKILPVLHRNKRLRKGKTKLQGDPSSRVILGEREIPSGKTDSTHSSSHKNLELRPLKRKRRFSNSLKSLQMDKGFKDDCGTNFQVDSNTYLEELDKFWCVSELT